MPMEKAILIGVNINQENFEQRMDEMKDLAMACDISVEMRVNQNLEHPHTKFYLNPGKVDTVKLLLDEYDCSLLLVLDTLRPSVQRNLSNYLDCEVMDKSALILEIFARRAKTKESILQVECARLKYLLPRLQGSYAHMDRQRGGTRNKGMGEKKIELDGRRIEAKIHSIEKELKKIDTQRNTQRNLRKKSNIKSVTLVGYTNEGKSTLLNHFVEEDKKVFEKNMLFATLITSTRKIETKNHNVFTLSDTVGFISDLPHNLIQAFHSTLEEAVVSDLLLKVVDASNPNKEDHIRICNETLEEIGCKEIPYLYIYNKCDLTDLDYPKRIDNRIYISAKDHTSIQFLKDEIEKELFHLIHETYHLPYTQANLLNYLHKHAKILKEEYKEDEILIECIIQKEFALKK